MKHIRVEIIILVWIVILPSFSSATEMESAVGWSLDAGPVISDDIAASLSTTATFIVVNGTVDFKHYFSGDQSDTVRAYVGLGLGPAIQVQLGMGEGGTSGRLRMSVSLRRWLKSGSFLESWGDGYPDFPSPGSLFNRGWVLSGFAEIDSDKQTTWGLAIGFLLI